MTTTVELDEGPATGPEATGTGTTVDATGVPSEPVTITVEEEAPAMGAELAGTGTMVETKEPEGPVTTMVEDEEAIGPLPP